MGRDPAPIGGTQAGTGRGIGPLAAATVRQGQAAHASDSGSEAALPKLPRVTVDWPATRNRRESSDRPRVTEAETQEVPENPGK